MATTEAKLRRDIGSWVREYEAYLEQFEERLRLIQRRIDKASGEAQAELGSLLADVAREAELVRSAGESVLRELRRGVEVGRGALDRAEACIRSVAAPPIPPKEVGKAVVRRAAIEVKALRHGVRVGLRVARRVSRTAKTTKP